MSKDIPFDELKVGDKYGPRPFDTSEKAVQRFCDEMGDQNPLWLDKSPWGGPVVPPLLSATLIGLGMIGTKYDAHATVPSRLIQTHIRPAFVGSNLTQAGTLIDKYIKRGLEYVAIKSVISDEAGNEVRHVTDHFLLSLERTNRADTPGHDWPKVDVEIGAKGPELPPFTRVAYQRALDDPARFRDDSSHRDDYARTVGFKSALLSGYLTGGYLNKYLVDYYGAGWLMGGTVSLQFAKAVQQRENITIRASVTQRVRAEKGYKVTLDFVVEKEDGTPAIIGTASGVK